MGKYKKQTRIRNSDEIMMMTIKNDTKQMQTIFAKQINKNKEFFKIRQATKTTRYQTND